jgi:hypothetical protein
MPFATARVPRATRRGPALMLLLGLAVLALAASPAVAQDDEAVALLQRSAETMAGLDSFHFELTTPRGRTLFLENLELAALEGDVQRPDRFRASATAKAAIIELNVDVVGVGTRLWITNPMGEGDQYEEIDLSAAAGDEGASISDLLNPDRVLLQAVEQLQNPTIAGENEIDGVDATRVDGTVDLSRIQADGTPVPGLRTDRPLPASIWIDGEGRVLRLELEGPITTVESSDVVRRLDLSAFNEPVDIQPPV